MEFTSRGGRGDNPTGPEPVSPNNARPPMPVRKKHIDWAAKTVRFELFTVIVGSALLLAAVSLYLGFSSPPVSEFKKVDSTKFQAVFLNGISSTSGFNTGSLYFGHITKITDKYMALNRIYYLTDQQNGQNGQASPQLTKLGCQQLHSPYDQMIIYRTQVAFWENLKDDGKVVQAIQQYEKQNPNGPS